MPPTWPKKPGSYKEDGFLGGIKPLKRRCKAERFYGKAQERKEERVTFFRSSRRSKALKSETQERWRMKKTSKEYASSVLR